MFRQCLNRLIICRNAVAVIEKVVVSCQCPVELLIFVILDKPIQFQGLSG